MGNLIVHVEKARFDIYIGRYHPIYGDSRYQNPYHIGKDGDRRTVISMYRRWLWEEIKANRITLDELRSLDGKVFGCWCSPHPCHGHVLAAAVRWAVGTKF